MDQNTEENTFALRNMARAQYPLKTEKFILDSFAGIKFTVLESTDGRTAKYTSEDGTKGK